MKFITSLLLLLISLFSFAQPTRFETSGGKETATYFEAINYYKQLDKKYPQILVKQMGPTDAGYPLHLALFSANASFDTTAWRKQGKVIILVNNGIHPGEPDGIDATMMLFRDLATGKLKMPSNVVLATIPVYNIGGSLNRNGFSRVNQNGPTAYGFRGNSQNLDINRDFIKADSKEALSFTQVFQYLQPDILIDNHVSDGADYQHTFTLLTTQYDKLGSTLGNWLRNTLEPALYTSMSAKGWDICPYVNFETASPSVGFQQFYDPPRYSSGYAALFGCIGFMPETHMLKPYDQRVRSTYAFMQTMLEQASAKATEIKSLHQLARQEMMAQKNFPLSWQVVSSRNNSINFKGYEAAYKPSEVTGQQRLYYDHNKPFTQPVKFYNYYTGLQPVTAPSYYVIPQGWHKVIDRLIASGVQLQRLQNDSSIAVEVYHINNYKAAPTPYESHHRNSDVQVTKQVQDIHFLKGDYLISLKQPARRFLVETLEPTGPDSYFAWNFFDGILQQKEGYSDYRWEDVAAEVLKNNPALQQEFNQKKQSDTAFAANASAQLNWVYKHSSYYEPAHLRYPVYRIP
jgi:hypothetical protein